MSVVAQKNSVIIQRGNISWYPYVELHQPVSELIKACRRVLEIDAECQLRFEDGTVLVDDQTLEVSGVKPDVLNTKLVLVAKEENGEWESLPVHSDPPVGPLDQELYDSVRASRKIASDNKSPSSSSTPSSSSQ